MNNFYSLVLSSILLLTLGLENPSEKDKHKHKVSAEKGIPYPSNCPASPEPTILVQPNGTTITIMGKGNMNNHWTETVDGYSIVLNAQGNYEYAQKVNGDLIPSGTLANNPANRSAIEQSYVTTLTPSLKPTFSPLKNAILNQVNAHLSNKTYPTTGNIRILALLIDYPDLVNQYPKSDFDSLLYGSNFRNGDGSFKYYYEKASDSMLTVDVDVRGWYRATNGYLYYGRDSGYDRAADLVREAVDAAELAGVNFANYDNDSDGDVDGILVVHSGPGAEQGSQTQYIWSHRWVMSGGNLGAVTYDGKFINDYMMNPETRTRGVAQNLVGIGVFCHEFGHNLGLPDLYDTDDSNGDSEGIGNWGLMAGGTWLGGEHRPSNFSAWSRVENGWETPTVVNINSSGNYSLKASSDTVGQVLRVNTALSNEYFLLENRQKTNLDRELNGTGLAIWHINTTKTNSFGNRVNGDENLKGVDLEEADGLNDLDNEVNRGDGGDLFPGTSNNTSFNDLTNPNANDYVGGSTGLNISNISENGGILTFSFGNSSAQACTGGDTILVLNGSFNDGSGTSNYANNLNCTWLIQPPGATSITIGMNSIATELNNDLISIYDGNDATAPLLGTYSGTSAPNTFTSSGGSLFVVFSTNSTVTSSGWDAFYSSTGGLPSCSGTTNLTAISGTFDDGSGAGINYTDTLNCSWLINPPGIANIRLDFDSLDLIIGDTLYVYDGLNNNAPLVGAYTGSNIPASITSSGANLFIEFITDTNNTDKGWQLSYNTFNGCTGQQLLTAAAGTFNDGTNANVQYQSSNTCTWLIQPPGANFISLSWNRFQTETGFDFVTVYDGATTAAPQLGSFSGSLIPSTLTSSGGSLLVEFRTDFSVNDFGWEATYASTTTQCLPNRVLTANSGSFSDGSGTNNYGNNLNCGWLIQPNNANSITLSFSAFDTETNVDEVRVYDGVDNTAPLLNTFSGTNIPANTLVNGPAMFVEFITDGANTAAGWDASYTSTSTISCSGQTNLTASSGSFDDGSGASFYDPNLNCTWLIQPPGNPNVISLNFTSMGLQFGDRVRIFDGINATSGTLIGIRSGTNLGNPLIANSGAMFLEFTSNGSGQGPGWDASYSSSNSFCVPNTTLTGNFGSFNDGSGFAVNYADNTDCEWLIQPTAPNIAIRLNLSQFDTELGNDTVTVYDGPNTTSPILATLSGNLGTVPPILSSAGDMLVTFKTNGSVTADGWNAFYTTQSVPACSGTTNLTAASGTFDDGSAPTANYVENSNCSWLIQPSSASRINLSFNRFNTQARFDTVTVYDGATTSDPILGTFSGTSIPPNVISTGGQMLVTFNSNAFGNSTGWEATYNSTNSQCFTNLVFTQARDTIRDGSGPANYGNNLNCSWLIQPASALTIDFDFLTIDLQANDSVILYDGNNSSAPRLGAFSGTTIPATVSSTGGSMFVEFITDASGNAAGWEAVYDITSNLSCIGTTTFTTASGTFDDGSGPRNYDNNLNCSWLIQPTGSPVSITLDITNTNLANFGDLLRVYDGTNSSGTLLRTFFFNTTGSVTAFSGSMFLEFTTDPNSTGTGWDASYTSSNTYCSPTNNFTANFGNFTDGSPFGTNYLNNTDCSWLIEPIPTNVAIRLNIFSIDTELGSDTITVYDGTTTADPILGTFSGNTSPIPIVSSANKMLVTFKSNGSVTGGGFRASYTTQSIPFCAGQTTLTAFSGSFNDGSPRVTQYIQNSNCTWLIQPPGAVSIDLNFNYFDTESVNDVVTVYNGATTSAPVLGTFSGNRIPPTLTSGSAMLVEFTTNGFTQRTGFGASYTASTSVNLAITEDTIFVNSGIGNVAPFNIVSNATWTVTENAPWMLTNRLNGSQNQSVNAITTQPNIGPPRSAFVFVDNASSGLKDSVLVIQRGSGDYLTSSPDTLFFPFSASSQKFEVIANVNWSVAASGGTASFNPSSGNTDDSVQVSLPANNSSNILSFFAVISSTSPNVTNDTVVIIQDSLPSQPPTLSATPDTITIAQTVNSSATFTVNSTVIWQTSSPDPWVIINNPASTRDTNTVQVSAGTTNLSTNDRFSYVAVQDIGSSIFDTVVVRQLGGTLILDASPKNVTLGQAANSTATSSLTANLDWIAVSSDPTWLNVAPPNGSSNATLTLTALSPNLNTNPRTGYIALSGLNTSLVDTIFVTQDGIPVNLSVNPKNIALPAAINSTDSFTVNSNVNWQTMSGATWLTVVNPTPTADTNKVTIIANTANTGIAPRGTFVAVMDVNGTVFDTVFVGQLGSFPTLVANPDTIILEASSGTSKTANLAANVNWTATPGATWFSVAPSSGSSVSTLTLTATLDNLGSAQRVSFLAINQQGGILTDTIVVIQDTASVLKTTPDTLRLAANSGSTGNFDILTPTTNFMWNSNPVDNWISLSQNSGMGPTNITVTATANNPSSSPRITYVQTIPNSLPNAVDTLVVVQEGFSSQFTVSPNQLNLNFTSGSNANINVNSNVNWSVTNPVTWLSLSTTTGSNNGVVTVTANSDNLSGGNRTATLIFSSPGQSDQMVMVTQIDGTGPSFATSLDTVYVDEIQGSTANFGLLANQVNWTLAETTPWFVINPASGNNTQTITVTAAGRNITGNERVGLITASANGYADLTVTVIQRSSLPLFQASPAFLVLGSDSLDFVDFNISSNLLAWKVEENADWMRVNPDSGAFSLRVRVTALTSNRTGNVRSEVLTISAPPLVPQTVLVRQDTVRAIGLEELNLANAIQLYPNPTSGKIFLEFDQAINPQAAQFQLYNSLGSLVTESPSSINSNRVEFDLHSLPAGFYYLNIQTSEGRLTKKVSLINR